MAGKVNTKFVVLLSGGMVAMLAAAVAVGLFIKSRSGPDLINKGDAALAAKDYDTAEKYYSRAVNKDQTNIQYLEKWLACLSSWVPPTQPVYIDKYRGNYRMIKRQIALLKRNNVAAHREYLDLLWEPMKTEGLTREAAEVLSEEVVRSLALFGADSKEKSDAEALRAYRGEAYVRLMADPASGITEDQIKLAKEDLEAALAADPNDADTAVALMNWHLLAADSMRKSDRLEQAAETEAKGVAVLDDFIAKHPGDAEALLNRVVYEVETAQTEAAKNKIGLDMVEAIRQAVAGLKPRLDELAAALRAAGPGVADRLMLLRFKQIESIVDDKSRFARTRALAEEALAKKPDDFGMLFVAAQCAADQGDLAAANDLLTKVVNTPQLPISFEGVRQYSGKMEATYFLAAYALQQWERSTDDPAKQKALIDQARKYREDLKGQTGEDSTQLVFIDAMLRFAEQDWVNAKRLLVRYNELTKEQNMSALWTLARVEIKLNNTGAAKQICERLSREVPGFIGPIVLLAQIEHSLNNTTAATSLLKRVLQVEPDNKSARELLAKLEVASGAVAPEDPVQRLLGEAQKMIDGNETTPPNIPGALAKLQDAMKTIKSPILPKAVAQIKAQTNDKPGAIEVIQAAIKDYPEDKQLPEILARLTSQNPMADEIKKVQDSDQSPIDKAWRTYEIYASYGEREAENAKAALAEAERIDPADRRVLEKTFLDAIRAKDWPRAEQKAKLAAEKDVDKCGGRLFTARLLASQDQVAEAAAMLQELANSKIADVETMRLLGRLYAQLGRLEDAELAFKEALRLRNNDLPSLIDYVKLLAQQNKNAEALTVARQSEKLADGDPEFVDLLLTLEAAVGDRQGAMARRETIMVREPANMINKLALAKLKVDLKRWVEAQELIDELRKFSDEVELAELQAKFFAERKEPEKSTEAMESFIARQKPGELGYEPFMRFGQFLVSQRRLDDGIAMMERGRPFQNPKTMEMDRLIADTLASSGRPTQAAEVYQKIVDAGADGPRQEVRTRLTEILVQLKKYDEALVQLDQIKPPKPPASLALMRAEIAVGKGDEKAAREQYARVIQDFPTDPVVYLKRAQWHLSRGKPGIPEAMQDLEAAIRVKPNFWQAYRVRSIVHAAQGETDKAIQDLRDAIKANPGLEELRLGLMRELVKRDRGGEAAEIADEAIRMRPNDINVALSCASVFTATGDWTRAQRYLKVAWDLDHRPDIALLYIDAILNAEGANPGQAEAILTDPAIVQGVPSNASFIVLRARMYAKRNRPADAARDVIASMNVLELDNPDMVLAWWRDVRKAVPQPSDAAQLMDRPDVPVRMREWAKYLLGGALGEVPAGRPRAVSLFQELFGSAGDKAIQLLAIRQLGTLLYQQGRETEAVKGANADAAMALYADAAKAWSAGIGRFPDDPELLNNLAFVYAKHLNKPQEALPHAEKAIVIVPNSSDALDTLGFIYMQLNQLDKAEETFKKANIVAGNNASRLPIAIHLGQLFTSQKKKVEAKSQLDVVDEILKISPELERPYKADIEELRKKINSL